MDFRALKNKKFLVFILIILIVGALIVVFNSEIKSYLAEKYRLEGKNYLMAGDYNKAKESFNKVLKLDPYCPVAHYQLGNVFVKLGDYELAKEYFNKALRLGPHPLIENGSYLGLGGAYFFIRDYETAVDYIQKSLSENIENIALQTREEVIETTAYLLLGSSFYFLGDLTASEEYFNKALELELENPLLELAIEAKAYNGLGFLYLLLGNYEQALEFFNKSIALDETVTLTATPSSVRYLPYFGKGIVYHALKDYDKAKESLEKSLELLRLYPQLPQYTFYEAQIYNKLGKTAIDNGNFNEAENYFKEVIKMKDQAQFETDFQIAYTQVDAYDGLGEIALNFENYPEALTYFENGLSEIPDKDSDSFQEKWGFGFMEILFHYRKAFIYYKINNFPEAKVEIKKSVELTESLSPEIYSIIENMPWFKDGESIFQKVYSLQNELGG